jgi:uncharacterized membrane protein
MSEPFSEAFWTLALNSAVTIVGLITAVITLWINSNRKAARAEEQHKEQISATCQTKTAVDDNTRLTATGTAVGVKLAENQGINGKEVTAAKEAIAIEGSKVSK